MIGIKLDKVISPLFLIPKISGYVKKFKAEDKINKIISFCKDDDKLLRQYKSIWTKMENFKNIKLNALPVFDDRL